jgi:type IV secretion system protein VirB1
MMRLTFLFAAILLTSAGVAQDGHLTVQQFRGLVSRCGNGAPADTLLAVARTESALYTNAVSLNRPGAAAAQAGFPSHLLVLAHQPRDRAQALRWTRWFRRRGYTVSVGLMQINIENAPLFHVTEEQLFEPCTNLSIGTILLTNNYERALRLYRTPQTALKAAFSAYNSGSFQLGFSNGYVASVMGKK